VANTAASRKDFLEFRFVAICFVDGGFMDGGLINRVLYGWRVYGLGLCFCFQKFFPEAVTPRFLRTSSHGLCQGFMGLKTES
jgi:hypothetical protein